MNEIAVVEKSKDYFKNLIFNIRYGKKFKKIGIEKNFADILIRSKDKNEQEILELIRSSKSKEDFSRNIIEYLKSKDRNVYASTLLIGNLTGRYVFNDFYYDSIKELNLDSFSNENQTLLNELKSHFIEYIINNNKRKNTFAERIKVGESSMKDLSRDINESEVLEDFERVLNGIETTDTYTKPKRVEEYLMKTIGVYSEDDIKNNFNFILYDIDSTNVNSLEDRRKKYILHSSLSNEQLRKIDEITILKNRLQGINNETSKHLLERLNRIGNNYDENIIEIEGIYADYEIMYREDLIDNLYSPINEVTIIENYEDIKPQLIHQFIRSPEKFREMEIKKAKERIISERTSKNDNLELTEDEQYRLNKYLNLIDANLDQYKVNYSTDGDGTSYTDSLGFDRYHSDTSNQISASVFNGNEFVYSSSVGIIGIGFNAETLSPEAIAISSNNYKTTNKGLNNLEYNEEHEFKEMSSPLSELLESEGKSEVVMHRRGMDFDTKASYIFATIDSSNQEQTSKIMKQLEDIKDEENLKVVIYDIYKIRKSLEKIKEEEGKENLIEEEQKGFTR